jgi:hypothetical protein
VNENLRFCQKSGNVPRSNECKVYEYVWCIKMCMNILKIRKIFLIGRLAGKDDSLRDSRQLIFRIRFYFTGFFLLVVASDVSQTDLDD